MKDTYLVTFNNENKILVTVANKCGSSSVITILGYPFLGSFKFRKDTRKIPTKNWASSQIVKLSKDQIFSFTTRVAIIRDPVERFVSAYKDRVLQRNKDHIKQTVKSFTQFVNEYESIILNYRDIRNHTRSLITSYGSDPSIYTEIILTKNIGDKFIPLVENVSLTENIPNVFYKNSFAVESFNIRKDEVDKIKNLYKEDYRVYGNYF